MTLAFVPPSAFGSGSAAVEGRDDAALRAATRATEKSYRGTYRNVDPTPRPAVTHKRIAVISAGQAASSAKVPADAAVDAARAIGWDSDLYDAQLNVGNDAPLVRQAIASGVDGILLVAIDCQTVKQPLLEARAKRIVVIGIGAVDCNDPRVVATAKASSVPKSILAQDLVPHSIWGTGKLKETTSSLDRRTAPRSLRYKTRKFVSLYYINQGFKQAIERSGRSRIVATLEVTTADLTSNQLVPKIQAELLRHPEADWIKSPYTYATTLGIVPALGARSGDVHVMGNEGFEPELDLIRTGKVTAVNVFFSDWIAWAGIDAMNSAFRNEKPVDSGMGWMIADAQHNLPPSGPLLPPVDYQAQFRRAWGVG